MISKNGLLTLDLINICNITRYEIRENYENLFEKFKNAKLCKPGFQYNSKENKKFKNQRITKIDFKTNLKIK